MLNHFHINDHEKPFDIYIGCRWFFDNRAFYLYSEGKKMKIFGPDDNDAISLLKFMNKIYLKIKRISH